MKDVSLSEPINNSPCASSPPLFLCQPTLLLAVEIAEHDSHQWADQRVLSTRAGHREGISPVPSSIFVPEDRKTSMQSSIFGQKEIESPTFDLRTRRWKNPYLRSSASKMEECPVFDLRHRTKSEEIYPRSLDLKHE